MKSYLVSLADPQMVPTALRLALVVGTILFAINHGSTLLAGHREAGRWQAGLLTYVVPYCVNIHGQWTQAQRSTA